MLASARATNIHTNEFPNFMLSARLYFDVKSAVVAVAAHMHTAIFGAEHADVLQCDTKSVSLSHPNQLKKNGTLFASS
jgi:hypothetical protein